MSVVPGRQFCPAANFIDSFHTSLCKFHSHGVSLTISRRRSHYCRPAHNYIGSGSTHKYNSSNGIPLNHVGSHLTSSWLEKWKAPDKENRPKLPRPVLNYRASRIGGVLNHSGGSSSSSIAAVGGESGSTMDRIVEKLKKFGYLDDVNENGDGQERVIEKGSVEDIFYVEEGTLPNTQGGFSPDSPLGVEKYRGNEEVRFPWEKPTAKPEDAGNSVKRRSRTFMAELTLPESELRRLRHLTLKTKKKIRITGSGVTQSIVEDIQKRWKGAEIVRLKIEGAPALNMKRVHEILERKTGGLVIWRSGTSVSLYRGVSYEVPSQERKRWEFKKKGPQLSGPLSSDQSRRNAPRNDSLYHPNPTKESFQKTSDEEEDHEEEEVNYEDEIEVLLSDLGPRYTDWSGGDPLPVDADLLPSVVPGYQPPFRLLPYGVRRSLGPKDATALRRIARTLPPHFALGRSRQLEGLAAAIVKLWERSSIAKVALKRGVQHTTSERMAEDIKRLTGGILLSRNKDFLVFYRGKDFLSADVKEVLLERERLAKSLQDKEEEARMKASAFVAHDTSSESAGFNVEIEQPKAAGTLYETLDANAKWGKRVDDHEKEKMLREAELMRHADLVRKLEKKLAFAERKVVKAEQALSKVEEFLRPVDRQSDPDCITDEERFMFRKLGLKMKAFLLLGRRGVFDGTVENMHLHWKYRELVKIIVKAKIFEDVKNVALALEAESGGVLVSVDKVSKGYAIIVFRGKEYQRPSTLRPKNLLSKRKALARSIELQRREALLKNIAQLQQNVDKLRSELDRMDALKDQRDSSFYDSLDAAYPTEDEDSEEDEDENEDEAFLETYDDDGSEDEYEFSPEISF